MLITHPDDEYKQATKEVVDDMLREDVLGPRICAILANHTPASEKVKNIIAEAITKEPSVKKAIEGVIEELDSRRKSRWIDRLIGAIVTIVIAVLGGLILNLSTNWFDNESPQTEMLQESAL